MAKARKSTKASEAGQVEDYRFRFFLEQAAQPTQIAALGGLRQR